MPEVSIKKGEPIDRALKRLKQKLEIEGTMDELRRLRSFENPVDRAKRKQRTAAKRAKLKIRVNLSLKREGAAEVIDDEQEDVILADAPLVEEAVQA